MDPYQHRCVDESTGNKLATEVRSYDIEYNGTCDNCGELLAPSKVILAHMYEFLLNQKE